MSSHHAVIIPMSHALALLREPSEPAHPPLAISGWALEEIVPTDHSARLNGQALMLARLADLASHAAGVEPAIELRYLVTPASLSPDGQAHIETYLLLRLSAWSDDTTRLRCTTLQVAEQWSRLMGQTLHGYKFAPIAQRGALLRVLQPWRVRDTVEVHRVPMPLAPSDAAFAPLGGVLDANYLLDAMAQDRHQTMLSLRIEPVASNLELEALLLRHARYYGIFSGADDVATHSTDELHAVLCPALASSLLDPAMARTRLRRRVRALRQSAFRLRIQMASNQRLGLALCTTLLGEVNGPGHLTVGSIWPSPDTLLAGSATCTHPRPVRCRRGGRCAQIPTARTEMEVACNNLAYLLFDSFASGLMCSVPSCLDDPCMLEELVDIGEATRIVGLPSQASQGIRRNHAQVACSGK